MSDELNTMLSRSTLLRASMICVLLWISLLGVLIDADQGAKGSACTIIVSGTVNDIVINSSRGINSMTVWDGCIEWHFDFNQSIPCPETGDAVVVFSVATGGPNATVTRIEII